MNKFLKNYYLNFLSIKIIKNNKFFIKIYDRNIFINKNMLGLNLAVYNGKYFIPLLVKESMVGKMLGSLIFTKKILIKKKKK